MSENLFLDESDLPPIRYIDGTARWRARNVAYMAGRWSALQRMVPRFSIEDFRVDVDGPSNPHILTVVRLPLSAPEKRMPVGTVSTTYALAQHHDVVDMCMKGIAYHGVQASELDCEVGLTELGEWMHFSAYFPDSFTFVPKDNKPVRLRLECFNSVDGSSRLIILFGWLRIVCSNGLIVGETKAALRDTHDENLNLQIIPKIISEGLAKVKVDMARLSGWDQHLVKMPIAERWFDTKLAETWGKKAACRAIHICRSGQDVEILDPFYGGAPSEKRVELTGPIPGAVYPACTLYDVSQVLSWIASRRKSVDERLEWTEAIPPLIESLRMELKSHA